VNTITGQCVNIDFDCLFDKAKSFKVPEQVSFRLTRNLIDAFGVSGVEGSYRKSCEISFDVLKINSQVILNTLHSFVHDPLIDHKSIKGEVTHTAHSESSTHTRITDKAMVENVRAGKNALYNVALRLKGHVPRLKPTSQCPVMDSTSAQLSTQGQVQQLIEQSTSNLHLGKMFPGWMPFI